MNNANQDNLWQELTLQGHADKTLDSNLDVKSIMDSWTLKKGYPVVHVERVFPSSNSSTATANSSARLVVKQRWFLLNPDSKMLNKQSSAIYDNYKWFVPFTFTTKAERHFDFETKAFWLKPSDSQSMFPLIYYDE